jgi:hypothetical protein
MQPQTILHNSVRGNQLDALYMNRAAQLKYLVERISLVVISRLANCIYTSTFLKPLTPMLGETVVNDGQTTTMNCLDERYSNTFIGTGGVQGPREPNAQAA